MKASESKFTVSVVVPCRNEKDHIESALKSILAQEPPPGDFEVIVADGMSTDGTREILERIACDDLRLKIIDNPEVKTPCGMNAGIRHAEGQYIAIMGAHCRYALDYLKCSMEVSSETGADNVGGSMMSVGKSALQRLIAIAHHSAFAVGGARWHDVNYEGPADTVFGGFYRREVFDRIGFFDEELVRNQDDEFNLRLTRAGGRIWHSPRVRSWYTPRSSLKALFRQYAQYGYWKVRVIQKHKVPASIRHLVPGGFVLLLSALLLAGIVWPLALWVLVALLAAYLGCNIAAVLLTPQKGWACFVLPFVFATYHFGYGLGFLHGVLDFVVLRRGPSGSYTKLTRTSVVTKVGS